MKDSVLNQRSFYVLVSDVAPTKKYKLVDEYTLEKVEIDRKFRQTSILPDSNQGVYHFVALPYFDKNSFKIYKDLVVFHAFFSNYIDTYVYAEKTINSSLSSSQISPVRQFSKLGSVSKTSIDYRSFLINVIEEDTKDIEIKINYAKAFKLFLSLKSGDDTKKLYNLICLWVFASGLESVHTIYTNTNLVASLYILILEALLDKPKQCENVIDHCDYCNRNTITHDKISRSQIFKNRYGDSFKPLLSIRHETFHEGSYFDLISDLLELLGSNSEKERKLFNIDSQIFSLQYTSRNHLIQLFMDKYSACS